MNTDLNQRGIAINKKSDIITAYKLIINKPKKFDKFITLDKSELAIKALEVFDEVDECSLVYSKVKTTRGEFLGELKRLSNVR